MINDNNEEWNIINIFLFLQSYPDENHGLGDVTKHLYHSMDQFWTECLELQENQV